MKLKLAAITLVAIFLVSCGSRDMASPAGRLVGHWTTKAGDHLYYSKTDSDGLGSYILVQPDGNTAHHRYKVLSEVKTGERVIVQLQFADGDTRNATYDVSKDGKIVSSTTKILFSEIAAELTYVDGRTKP